MKAWPMLILGEVRFIYLHGTRKGPAQARVSMDIFHDGLRRETCSDTRVHYVHFANCLRGIYAAE